MPEPKSAPFEILTLPCLSDNYAFLLHDRPSGETALVDAPESAPVLRALASRGWRLDRILLTHHHADHVQAVPELVAATGARVTGAAADAARLPPLDAGVAEGDEVAVGGLRGRVIEVSGHTINHIAFHFPEAAAAFTGDSLMALGCGRVFEGEMAQMWQSLGKLAALPPATLICSGHEYTAANARFAATIEPENAALAARVAAVAAARAAGRATVPSRLAEELATNPFLRAGEPGLARALGMAGRPAAEVFAEIRSRKDRF
jgi:hydroxyacylglutathione hydrolase